MQYCVNSTTYVGPLSSITTTRTGTSDWLLKSDEAAAPPPRAECCAPAPAPKPGLAYLPTPRTPSICAACIERLQACRQMAWRQVCRLTAGREHCCCQIWQAYCPHPQGWLEQMRRVPPLHRCPSAHATAPVINQCALHTRAGVREG